MPCIRYTLHIISCVYLFLYFLFVQSGTKLFGTLRANPHKLCISISLRRLQVSTSNFQIFAQLIHRRASFQLSIWVWVSMSSSGRSWLAYQMLRPLSKTCRWWGCQLVVHVQCGRTPKQKWYFVAKTGIFFHIYVINNQQEGFFDWPYSEYINISTSVLIISSP